MYHQTSEVGRDTIPPFPEHDDAADAGLAWHRWRRDEIRRATHVPPREAARRAYADMMDRLFPSLELFDAALPGRAYDASVAEVASHNAPVIRSVAKFFASKSKPKADRPKEET